MSIPQHLVFYDGECGFCDGTVQWLLKRDQHEVLYFAPLQGELAQQVLVDFELPSDLDSIVYVQTTEGISAASIYSTAIAQIVRQLPAPWSWARWMIIIPRAIRDWGYQQFAKRRFRWFGKVSVCTLPSERQSKRLLY